MSKPIVNLDELDFEGRAQGQYEHRTGQIGQRIGARQLGYNLTVVPPGKRGYPLHSHYVNEEMFFVLSGSGEVRIGSERYPIRAGDVIACPAGGAELAHQIINTSEAELRYLSVSTRQTPELVIYPDSNKYGVLARLPSGTQTPELMRHLFRREQSLDYFDGEDGA